MFTCAGKQMSYSHRRFTGCKSHCVLLVESHMQVRVAKSVETNNSKLHFISI